MRGAEVLFEFASESLHLRAADEGARRDDLGRGLIDLRFKPGVAPLEVYHLNRFHHFTALPGSTSFSGMTTAKRPSAPSAERIMPSDVMPLMRRGSKLATKQT